MKILMVTNTYTPIVGGVEESISAFTEDLRSHGHEVVIVAPEFDEAPKDEKDVIRIPSIQQFNNTDWSVNLPLTGELTAFVKKFQPDIIHSHHPFLLGDVAVRLCLQFSIPLVFTYHTMYEDYIHYLPVQNDLVKRFVIELAAGYANLANHIIAPSESVRAVLKKREVGKPIDIVPTGIDLQRFLKGSREQFRSSWKIPLDAFVVGHVGRLAPEKNLDFLTQSTLPFIQKTKNTYFLVIGKGASQKKIQDLFDQHQLSDRLILTNTLRGQDLVDGYHAMDIFAFASQTETQGLVLAEAMAAQTPVVAVDAPGAREVVDDQKNGRLLRKLDKESFEEALDWCYQQSDESFQELKSHAKRTAVEFSRGKCLEKLLKVYQKVQAEKFTPTEHQQHIWKNLKNRFKAEWSLLKNMIDAGETAIAEKIIDDRYLVKSHLEPFLVKVRRWFNQSEWAAKLLRLNQLNHVDAPSGLVMIQIDGFSMHQLKKATTSGKMPFLKRLMEREEYHLYPFYTGLPSSTPAVQGELFYGVKQIVPAFSYYDERAQRVFTMFDGEDTREIEERLNQEADGCPLLEGGSSYSNVYTGGAKEAHFCATSLGIDQLWSSVHPFKLFVLLVVRFFNVIYIALLVLLECFLACVDFFIGLSKGKNFWKEFKFIPTRALICIFLREIITLGTRIDIARGLPIIHMNFIGYDEQSHRRGPSSYFAHRALKGIDQSLARIYRAALYATRRNYDVWIYSDHGQEDVESYIQTYGQSVKNAVSDIFKELNLETQHHEENHGELHQRVRYFGKNIIDKFLSTVNQKENRQEKVIVTAVGPTGNIYLPIKFEDDKQDEFATKLVRQAHIPLVCARNAKGTISAWNANGRYQLPEDAEEIFGANHPYIKELTDDLIRLVQHPHAGDFLISGWRPGEKPLSFPVESGAHAGIGSQETDAFALLPLDINIKSKQRDYVTTSDMRETALKFLGKKSLKKEGMLLEPKKDRWTASSKKEVIRIMTYNVHSCIGMDGKISPNRIARIIGRHKPDIVALQELDMTRVRTGSMDQPHIIAQELQMMYHFHPVIRVAEEHYGNAVLTKLPIDCVQAKQLPPFEKSWKGEKRGALWTTIQIGDQQLNFMNTHLGLSKKERKQQAEMLISEEWLAHKKCGKHIVLVGDFNALPESYTCQTIGKKLHDVQKNLKGHMPQSTWLGHYPMRRIDHIFVSETIEVVRIKVPRTELDKVASDHLPLIVDIRFKT